VRAAIGMGDVEQFRAAVVRALGLQFDETRSSFLEEVLRRRLDVDGRSSADYFARLEADPSPELRELARELTVGETYFFRNSDQFRALAESALPDRMRARASDRRLRILSAGCASGEEAYSLSIVAQQAAGPSWDVSILAVDVNPAALEKAQRARFSPWALRETTPELLSRWFRPEGRESVLDQGARLPVRFEERNLVDDALRLWQHETYDVVFCRNVLMYFSPEKAQAVVARIARALVPGGYLFLGHAETLRGLSSEFHLRHTHETFYYQRRDELGDRGVESSDGGVAIPAPTPAGLGAVPEGAETWVDAIRRATERIDALTNSPRVASDPPRAARSRRADLGAALDLLERERYAEALERVAALPSDAASDPDALLLRAVLLTHRGQLRDAEDTCAKLLTIEELNAGAHYALALCREAAGDLRGAHEQDQVAVYLDRSFAMPRLHLGLVARKRGDLDTARRELGQALVLLQREDAARILLFGGGFGREALLALCRAELAACGGER
jgi:chemotaxis protein methyltransferase CheR